MLKLPKHTANGFLSSHNKIPSLNATFGQVKRKRETKGVQEYLM
jgi:hypothetical protein